MNLIPTLISLGLAASVSVFYLQNQSDEPNKINYRAAFSDFEQTALEFAAHTPLQDISAAMPPSHCANLSYDFEDRLPASSESAIDISGLNCDMATLKISTSDEKDFQALLSAASASGRSYATETDTSATPPTKTIKWTQRLYSRNTFDLSIKAKLKNTYTGNCISCTSSTKAVHGDWSHKPNERWGDCPAPGVLACGETGTRRCNNPSPSNYGKECQRDQTDNSWTTPGNRTETRNCLGVPSCSEAIYTTCPTNNCLENHHTPPKSITCPESGSPCKLNDGRVVASGYIEYCNTPLCGTWEKENKCATMHCLNIGEKDPEKPKCIGTADQACINDQGILVTPGTREKCQLPACTKSTIDVACPGECQQGDGYPIEKFSCNGARCKHDGSGFRRNDKWSRECLARRCGILTKSEIKGIKSHCIPKDSHIQNDRPTITYTCIGEFGCKDEKGKFYEGDKSTEERLNLPGCPYWGEWYDNKNGCQYHYNREKKEYQGKKTIKRDCYRVQSNGIPKKVGEELCTGEASDEVLCDYPWGKWDRKGKSCPNCVKKNDYRLYGICDGGENNKKCRLGDTLFEPSTATTDSVAYCYHAVPKCGDWSEWSACKFEDNGGYGSCSKMEGTKTRMCSKKECEPHDLYWTFTKAGKLYQESVCHTPKCEVKIDTSSSDTVITSSSDTVINKNKGTIIIREGEKRDVRLIIKETAVLTSTKIENCAFTIKSHLKSMTLINHGVITGYPGKGGDGGQLDSESFLSEDFNIESLNGHNGKDGGDALCITKDLKNLTIRNYGVIKGGRAGGGGGGAACYKKTLLGKIDDYGCLEGGDGGDGSNFYLQSIVDGKPNQQTDIDSYRLKSGSGGNGGYLFPDSGSFKLDQAKARSGVNPVYDNNDKSPDIEVFKGDGGKPGNDGEICKLSNSYSQLKCPNLIN